MGLAKILHHTCRYLDENCVINYNYFERQLHKIGPDVQSTRPTGDVVPNIQHVLLTHTCYLGGV